MITLKQKDIHVVDGGCTKLSGLEDRCKIFNLIHGEGKVYNHPDGLLYENHEGYRIVVNLLPEPIL